MALAFAATVTNRWFTERRGLVTGVLTAASASGQLIFLPLLSWIVETYDWRPAAVTVALAALAVVPFVWLLLHDHPADVGDKPYGAEEFVPSPRPSPALLLCSARPAGAVKDAEVPDQPLQAPPVPRGRDHRVRGDAGAVGQQRLAVQPSIAATTSTRPERTASIRPTSCTGMAPSATRRQSPVPGCGNPLVRQVGHADPGQWPGQPVHQRDRQPPAQDTGALGGPSGGRAADDVRRRAHGEPDPGGPALHQVHGDLRARVAHPDHQDVPARAGRGTRRRAGTRRCTCPGRASPARAGCGCNRWRPPPRRRPAPGPRRRAAATRPRRAPARRGRPRRR
ncbi:hypothetical protein STENM327S_02670 [Streptomyces tendae]